MAVIASADLSIVQVNLAWDPGLATPEALLARYHTLTGWSGAVSRAGAHVLTVQRFSGDARTAADGASCRFVADGAAGTPPPWAVFPRVIAAVADARPDVIHVNGLMFPGMAARLRRQLARRTTLVLQDHSGALPARWPWPLDALQRRRWGRALASADACTFTATELAARWHARGLPADVPVLEIPEASTTLTPVPRDAARRETGLDGAPAVLWVGRLDANKDPLTALTAFERARPRLPDARLWMIFHEGRLEDAVRARVAGSPPLAAAVRLVGPVPHARMAAYYSAADVLLAASHHEGSGYAVIEAMACGLVPCVTDIPPFRRLTGTCGARWTPGDADAGAAALVRAAAVNSAAARADVRRHFDDAISWDAVGRLTVSAYRRLAASRHGTAAP